MEYKDIKVSLSRLYYPVKVLGPGDRVGIWLNGCRKRCESCVSPEMQQYDPSKEIPVDSIIKMITGIQDHIDGFTISGGEPFYNPNALCALVQALVEISDDILIFSGYTHDELIAMKDPNVDRILANCAVLIDGEFVKTKSVNVGLRGSSNQQCWIFKYPEKYDGIIQRPRELQTVVYGNSVLTIGIPWESK